MANPLYIGVLSLQLHTLESRLQRFAYQRTDEKVDIMRSRTQSQAPPWSQRSRFYAGFTMIACKAFSSGGRVTHKKHHEEGAEKRSALVILRSPFAEFTLSQMKRTLRCAQDDRLRAQDDKRRAQKDSCVEFFSALRGRMSIGRASAGRPRGGVYRPADLSQVIY